MVFLVSLYNEINMAVEKKSTPWDWVQKLPFRHGDQYDFVKYGTAGFFALGSYFLGTKMWSRSISQISELEDADIAEDLVDDPTIVQALISLQAYRFKNPLLFRRCVEALNDIVFYEKQLLREEISPTSENKFKAAKLFKTSASYLNQFQMYIREEMGVTHGKAANIYVKTILDATETHFDNCLQVCSQFDPYKIMQQIQQDALKEKKAFEEEEARAYERGQHKSPYLEYSRKQMEQYAPKSTARKYKRLYRKK